MTLHVLYNTTGLICIESRHTDESRHDQFADEASHSMAAEISAAAEDGVLDAYQPVQESDEKQTAALFILKSREERMLPQSTLIGIMEDVTSM